MNDMLRRIVLSVLIELTIVSLFVLYANSFESLPYNVRELFASNNPLFTIFLFSLALYVLFGVPIWLASWLTVGRLTKYLLFPVIIATLALIVWFLLRGSVPMESLHDIVGAPRLNWPWEWELIFRFTGLFTAPAVLFCGAALLVRTYQSYRELGFRPILYWAINAALLLSYAHWQVIFNASTSNLIELMARGGDVISSVVLGLWIASLGLTTSIIVNHIVKRQSVYFIPFATLIFSIPLGYLLSIIGTENAIHKYGNVFSAMQFLLSQDRTNMASGFNLFLRYSIAHICLIILMGISQYPFWEWQFRKMKMQDVQSSLHEI